MISLLPKTALGNIVLGAVAAVVSPTVLRPVVVGVVRTGYEVKDFATSAWESARTEAVKIREEAAASRSVSGLEAQIEALRAEVTALKSNRKS